jgi:chromosome segregation ATPase
VKFNPYPVSSIIFLSLFHLGLGEPSPAPVIDLAARKESVVNLEAQIALREARLAELGQDIVTLDGRIEKRVDSLVKMLADTRDSQDSKTKVSKIKQDAIEGLRRGIDLYVAKRKEVAERVKKGDDAALGDLGKFNTRIATRVDQIVELSKSFPAHEDVKKYESDGGDYWNGYYYENSRISDEWKQNRRDNSQSKVQRDEVTTAIREGIARLDQRQRALKDALENRNPSTSTRKLYTQELGQIDAQLENLNAQLTEVSMPTGGAATRQPSLDEAIDMGQLLEDGRKDLRSDVSTLFRLYDGFDKERMRISEMKENLAARKDWLEKNAAAPK